MSQPPARRTKVGPQGGTCRGCASAFVARTRSRVRQFGGRAAHRLVFCTDPPHGVEHELTPELFGLYITSE
jgi:hypothetical protein